jgi:hypothetical protein
VPVNAATRASDWRWVAVSSMITTTRWRASSPRKPTCWDTLTARRPLTSTPSIDPSSMSHAKIPVHSPSSGSSPVQHGQTERQSQASKNAPLS